MAEFDLEDALSFDEKLEQLKEWIDIDDREFTLAHVVRKFKPGTPEEEAEYEAALEDLVKGNILEHCGKTRGKYRPRRMEMEEMNWIEAHDEPAELWLPFGLHDKVEIYDGNIIIFSGSPNSGKSALIYNTIRYNMQKFNTYLFNSESGNAELKKRLAKFPDISINKWRMRAYHRAEDFHDVVVPGAGNLNCIDFLEIHDDFYMVGQKLKQIHDQLKGAIAIIGLQKNPGSDTGLGGFRSMEVCRLALAIDFGKVKISKAKNFKGEVNPNGSWKNWKLHDGYQISHSYNEWKTDMEGKT